MTEQLGFGFDEMAEEARTAHIPATMEAAIPFYRELIEKHHAAMMAGDVAAAMAVRKEAEDLAVKLNGGFMGINGGPDAPCPVLERATAAPAGTIPLWGQTGEYTITVGTMPVKVEQDGIFGIGASFGYWPNFAAHVVEPDKPFLSETGYRSFMGCHADPVPGITPDRFATEMCKAYVQKDCKGKAKRVERSYVDRLKGERVGQQQLER
jgi:hypothetical protein